MPSLNRVTLAGHLGRDPELKYAKTGTAVLTFSMATTKKRKDGTENTQWHNVKAFGKQAEIGQGALSKGSGVWVEGSLETREYEKDGEKRYFTEVIAYLIYPLLRVSSKKDGEPQPAPAAPQPEKDDLPF